MSTTPATAPTDEQLAEVVRRIVEVCDPERIVIFGSTARGEATEHSDLDLLVIRSEFHERDRTLSDICVRLYGVRVGVDLVLATPAELDMYKDTHCLVYRDALRDGRTVYEEALSLANSVLAPAESVVAGARP
jgi:predicted nucleotidyltransferase